MIENCRAAIFVKALADRELIITNILHSYM